MTKIEEKAYQPLVERRSFPAASRLHAQMEEQARELHDIRHRLRTALAELGSLPPPLVAPSLGPQRRQGYLAPARMLDSLPPEGEAWWPDATAPSEPMRPAPGRRCAGLLDDRAPVIAVSMCGKSAADAATLLEQVIEQQIETRAFVPLFLTDDATQLHMFRHQGYDVELLPSARALEHWPGAIANTDFHNRRLEQIGNAWGVARFIDLGSVVLPVRSNSRRNLSLQPTLVFYKDYRRYNPYQHLLYTALPRIQPVAGDVEAAIEAATAGPAFFHINWEEAIYREVASSDEAMAIVETFVAQLEHFMALGGRIIWTLHNSEPHHNPFPDAYQALAGGIAARSSLVLVHSQSAASIALERYAIEEARLCRVPHGGYHTLYEGGWDRKAARQAVGLPAERIIFGFIGNVRPYKNVPLLIEAFCRLPRGIAALLLAGKQQPTLDLSGIEPEARAEMVINDTVIEEEVLPLHLAACDAVVLPFGHILTSGSLMLALSLETPVIVPAVDSLLETVVDGENGLVFAADDPDSLAGSLSDFATLGDRERNAMRAAAGRTARLCDWGWIGRHIADRLQALLLTE